jgi:DNA repair exonuclease SbcCD ATPase subunit
VDRDPLVDIASDLYALPPEDFVPARDDAVKRARSAGDKQLATALSKLRRPTVGAWAVNLLARERPDLVDDLLDLGEELRSAQRNLRGDELRDLSLRRRKLISELARTAVGLARRRNLPVAEIEATLTAALADEEVAAAVRAGVLAKTVEYAGFGETPRPQLRLLQGGAAEGARDVAAIDVGRSTSVRTGKAGPDSPTSISDAARKRAEREAAEREPVEQARREREERAKREREAAEREAREERERAELEAAELAERKAAEREEARRQAAELKRARAAANRELLAARTELSEAEAARVAAERAVTAAKRRVEKATAAVNALDR